MKNKYIQRSVTFLLILLMVAVTVALWRGIIPIDWLVSFGYPGIFFLSLINGVAPVAGPSQIATFFAASKMNPLAVGLAAGVGGAIGEVAGYAFGYFLRASQSENIESKIGRIANWHFIRVSRERSFLPLFVLASIPNPFFDPVSAIAGSLRIGVARYFFPVLLGKVIRHLAIAYAGYYSFTMEISSFWTPSTTEFLNSGLFFLAIIGIALLAWLVRTFAESEPDPLLLNFTFFAFAGQCIVTAELAREGDSIKLVWLLGLFLVAILALLAQVFVVRNQYSTTIDYYKEDLLEKHKKPGCSQSDIDHWAKALAQIIGLDFFPEGYVWLNKQLGTKARSRRRKQALEILPHDKFILDENSVNLKSLEVPVDERRWRWRAYWIICILSWVLFVLSLLKARGAI